MSKPHAPTPRPDLPQSAEEARRLGSTWYYTGRPCVHGHICKRQTINWGCWHCLLERHTRRRNERLEEERAKERAYYHAKRRKRRLEAAAARADRQAEQADAK